MAAVKALEAILKSMAKGSFQNVFLEWRDDGKNASLHGDYFERDRRASV